MADQFKPIVTTQEGRRAVTGARGALAGKAFAGNEEIAMNAARQQFFNQMGWGGLGGAAKRPPNSEALFQDWYAKQNATVPAQLAPTPAPTATPSAPMPIAIPSPSPEPGAGTKVGAIPLELILAALNPSGEEPGALKPKTGIGSMLAGYYT